MHVSALVPISLDDTIRFEQTLALAFRFSTDSLPPNSTHILTELDGECHRHIGPAKTLQVECLRTPYETSMAATVFLDSAKPRQTRWYAIPRGHHHLVIALTRATGPTADDGFLHVYLDGQSWRPLTQLPLYWRHHPTFCTIDTSVIEAQSFLAKAVPPPSYLSPVIKRRQVRRRR